MKNKKKTIKGKINNNMAKKAAKSEINESSEIVKFLRSISQKNYSEANKYLQNVIESKLKAKMTDALKEKIF
jgi:ribosomal protein L22